MPLNHQKIYISRVSKPGYKSLKDAGTDPIVSEVNMVQRKEIKNQFFARKPPNIIRNLAIQNKRSFENINSSSLKFKSIRLNRNKSESRIVKRK